MISWVIFQFFQWSSPDYYFVFYKIDNEVKIEINERLVYESGVIDGNPDLNVKVELNAHLKKGKNTIKVYLYNGSDSVFATKDEQTELYYELFENDDPIDYRHEKSTNAKPGLVGNWTHTITIK